VLLLRAGSAFQDAIGGAASRAGSAHSSSSSAKSQPEDRGDPYADDLDSDPSLTLPQKMAMRAQRRRQKEIEALGLRVVEAPKLPQRPEPPALPEKGDGPGVDEYNVAFDGEFLGHPMSMTVYVPKGEHGPASLACVLAPAASMGELNGRTRNEHDDPYKLLAQNGLVTVCFDVSKWSDNVRPQDPQAGTVEFIENDAGYYFARNALDFVLARMAFVDPQRMYAVGHGAAARASLYWAAIDPRIHAVATYDPVLDVAKHLFQPAAELGQSLRLADLDAFVKKTSPVEFAGRLKGTRVLVVKGKDGEFGNATGAEELTAFKEGMSKAGNPPAVEALKKVEDQNETGSAMMQMAGWLKGLPKGAAGKAAETEPAEQK
jgi:hypothetical protein